MPNYCECDLIIKGDKDVISKINNNIINKDPEKPGFDFNLIKPMPESLSNATAGSMEILYRVLFENEAPWAPKNIEFNELVRREKAILKRFPTASKAAIANLAVTVNDLEKDLDIIEKYKYNVDNYGYTSWYDWARVEWGTKWNSGSFSLKKEKCNEKQIFCTFNTAWSPPIPVIDQFAFMYPTASITMKYYECGAAYKGVVQYKNGIKVKDESSDYHGRRGG